MRTPPESCTPGTPHESGLMPEPIQGNVIPPSNLDVSDEYSSNWQQMLHDAAVDSMGEEEYIRTVQELLDRFIAEIELGQMSEDQM